MRSNLFLALLMTGAASAQTTLYSISRAGPSSGPFCIGGIGGSFGFASAADDFDDDGHADISVHFIHTITGGHCAGSAGSEHYIVSGRTRSTLRQLLGRVPFVGDVDGDGWEDVAMPNQGATDIESGRTGAVVTTIPPPATGLHDPPLRIGDIDGDGYDDLALTRPRTTEIYSGADASLIRTHPGDLVQFVGDVDGDRIGDLAIGIPQFGPTPGEVNVYSGATGVRLHQFVQTVPGDGFGRRGGRAGDVNGDGFADVFAWTANASILYSGADGSTLGTYGPEANPGGDANRDGYADVFVGGTLLSGFDGAVLYQHPAPVFVPPGSGAVGLGIGDFNRDGWDDFMVFANHFGQASVDVITLAGAATSAGASTEWIQGAACPGSNLALPHIGHVGPARLGSTMSVTLGGGRPNAPAVLHLGMPASIPLDVLGIPECTLLATPFVGVIATTDGQGRASYGLSLAANVLPSGVLFGAQWLALDPGANSFGLHMSDSLRFRIGN